MLAEAGALVVGALEEEGEQGADDEGAHAADHEPASPPEPQPAGQHQTRKAKPPMPSAEPA